MITLSKILKTLITSSTFILTAISKGATEPEQPKAPGAGILPYVIEHRKNHKPKIYFLLGRDNQIEYKNIWSDFGGMQETKESLKETAAREGTDELLGVISKEDILEKINNGAIQIGNTYLINIENIVGENPNELARGEFISKLKKTRKELIKDKKKYKEQLEKDKFAWFKGRELALAIKKKSKRLRSFMIDFYTKEANKLEEIS